MTLLVSTYCNLKDVLFTVTWFVFNKLCMLFNLNSVCVFQSCGVVVGCNGGWEACVGAPPN